MDVSKKEGEEKGEEVLLFDYVMMNKSSIH
jgi:hypothetical protein